MNAHVLLWLAAGALIVGAVALLPRVDVHKPLVTMLRVLVPSWRFFDAIGDATELVARIAEPNGDFGPWRPIIAHRARSWTHLVWNPDGNVALAQHGLVERLDAELLAEGTPVDRPADLVSYQLVLNLVRATLRSERGAGASARVQFSLISSAPNAPAFLSQEHAL